MKKKTIKEKVMERYYKRLAKERKEIALCHAGWSSGSFESRRVIGEGLRMSIDRLPSAQGNARDLI